MNGRIAAALAGVLLLSACGLKQGRCGTADTGELRRSLIVSLLSRDFIDQREPNWVRARAAAAAYLAANPDCCGAERVAVSAFDWLRWDRSSQPRYRLNTDFAYREGQSIYVYSRTASGDACGHVFDELRMGELAHGPGGEQGCDFTPEERARAAREKQVLACVSPAQARPRTPFPTAEASRLRRQLRERRLPPPRRAPKSSPP